MSDYHRTTRQCTVGQLHPELLQAVQCYFREHQWGDPEEQTLMCCETLSTRKPSGKLPPWLSGEADATIHTGMLLTAEMLIWVRRGERSGVLLTAAYLKDIQAKVYRSRLANDAGLEITGYIGDAKSRVRGYIGMGPEAAAGKFCTEVIQAIAKINPPASRRGLLKWLMG